MFFFLAGTIKLKKKVIHYSPVNCATIKVSHERDEQQTTTTINYFTVNLKIKKPLKPRINNNILEAHDH